MRKLTAVQLQSIQQREGLFDRSAWNECVRYLHALQFQSDPEDSHWFIQVSKQVATFVHWALLTATTVFSAAGAECLRLAATSAIHEGEKLHELHRAACIFSDRTHERLYYSTRRPEQVHASTRLQVQFLWWAPDALTGMESPHVSEAYVYESHYSFLIQAVYALGHFPQLIKQKASELACADVVQFRAHPAWNELFDKFNDMMYIVHAHLVAMRPRRQQTVR